MADVRTRHDSWGSVRVLLKRIRNGAVSKQKRRASIIEGIEAGNGGNSTAGAAENRKGLLVNEVRIATPPEPTVHKALVVARKGEYEIRHDFPIPALGDGEVMIRSHYVGLNPIDWKSVDYNFCLPEFPWVTGREMSGIVEKVGKDVTDLRAGDKVWTSTYYRDCRAGCFQELVVVPTHTVARIPDSISFEAAACLGVPALTACMTLWKWLNVPFPSSSSSPEETPQVKSTDSQTEDEWLLIWGGSTVTGQFATQVAAQSGLSVITVNSASTKALSERLGASYVVVRDGKTDDEILDEIRQATHGAHITRAIDLVGAKTAAVTLRAVSQERPVEFAPLAFMKSDQEVPANVTAHTVEMKRFVLEVESKRYSDELNKLLDAGKLEIPDIHLLEGGLETVQEGLELLKKGNLKGRKLVVKF